MKKNKKKKHQVFRIASLLKRRRLSKNKRRRRNIQKNFENKKKEKKILKERSRNRIKNIKIEAGTKFTLLNSPELAIELIQKLDAFKIKDSYDKNIEIDLSQITEIDICAISFLLAKVHEMTKVNKQRVWGRIPENAGCKKIFHDSGFLAYMTDLSGNKFKSQSDSFIVKVGSDKTRNERVGKAIEKAISFLTGSEQKYPPVYSIVQEICSNSVEWATSPENKNKNWFLGINLTSIDNQPSVIFTMTDIGFGILNTLNRKFKTTLIEAFTKETEILFRAFERKYGSKAKESNRNRGLPLIKDRFEKRLITNLVVITNNVMYDFENESKTRVLGKNFPGTFYCWNIDNKCVNKWKMQAQS